MFLKDEHSTRESFSLLDDFSACSGLKPNKSKCEGLLLGNERSNKNNFNETFGIAWPEQYVIALSIAFTRKKETHVKLNLDKLNNL